jgi:hypothetical protein
MQTAWTRWSLVCMRAARIERRGLMENECPPWMCCCGFVGVCVGAWVRGRFCGLVCFVGVYAAKINEI